MSTSESSSPEEKVNELPDLYRLLGLSPLETEIGRIEQALELVRKKAIAAKDTDIKLAQRASKIFSLGQKNLLDPERKSAYDRAWSKVYANSEVVASARGESARPTASTTTGSMANTSATSVATVAQRPDQSAEATTSELVWDMSELEELLPAEDPRAAFDFAGFLNYSENLPESNVTADYEKLQGFLGGVVTSTAVATAPESISAVSLLSDSASQGSSTSTSRAPVLEQVNPPVFASANQRKGGRVSTASSASLAKQMRQKRSRSFLLSVVGMLLGVGVVLGATLYLIRKGDDQEANQQAMLPQAAATQPLNNQARTPAPPSTPRGSGLPRVGGLDGAGATGDMPAMTPDPNMGMAPVVSNEPMQPAVTPAVPEAMNPAAMTPEPEPTPPTTPEPTPTPPEPAMPAEPALTSDEKVEWQKSMTAIRELLGNQEYDAAKAQLDASTKLAKTSIQRAQLKRLTTVSQLSTEFHSALVSAVTGLGGGETFAIGKSASASFIEGSATEIAIRFNGQNRTYKFTELPIGLANGLVDLKMDVENAKSLARKAAFALVHPKSNALALKEAREMMSRAAAGGATSADMPEVFDDDYSLMEKEGAAMDAEPTQ